jgi:hypothetical protein
LELFRQGLPTQGEAKLLNWKMPIRWSNNVSRGLLIRRSAIESEKKKKRSTNGVRRNNAVKVRTRQ